MLPSPNASLPIQRRLPLSGTKAARLSLSLSSLSLSPSPKSTRDLSTGHPGQGMSACALPQADRHLPYHLGDGTGMGCCAAPKFQSTLGTQPWGAEVGTMGALRLKKCSLGDQVGKRPYRHPTPTPDATIYLCIGPAVSGFGLLSLLLTPQPCFLPLLSVLPSAPVPSSLK